MKINLRMESESDYQQITYVNDKAFAQKNEGLLVEKLRERKEFIPDLSRIAIYNGQVIGHILFFPVFIQGEKQKHPSLSLAPMSVLPAYQKKQIGSQLVETGLDVARKSDFPSVLVLGHPEYYPRFGFETASHYGIYPPWDGIPD
ncbi:unnamed protein product, partial [marine sediment metagenome]